jgi:hypothetical protein
MSEETKKPTVKIELTPDQRDQIRRATGKEVPNVRLQPEELEERVTPGKRLN